VSPELVTRNRSRLRGVFDTWNRRPSET
jgi:hypothetical protein